VTIVPYLNFKGNCKEAFEFYKQALRGEIVAMLPHRGTPAEGHMAEECRDQIMHARLVAGSAVLMGSDVPSEHFEQAQGTSVSLHVGEPAEAERIFKALAEGGSVTMPIQETFWAQRFGVFTDRFGIPWMINCEKAA